MDKRGFLLILLILIFLLYCIHFGFSVPFVTAQLLKSKYASEANSKYLILNYIVFVVN